MESEKVGKSRREREMIQRTALAKYRQRASVHGYFGGGNSCDIYFHLFVVNSLDKQMQN